MGADISRTGSDAPAYGTEDARKRLFQWIETGQSAVITRERQRCSLVPLAALSTVQREAMAAWPAHGLTQARRVLGDLVMAASGGAAQRLQKRSRDVAVLLPVDAAPGPRRPRVLSTPSEALAAVAGNARPAPLSYGLPALDDVTGGLLPGRLTLIAAAPGVGGSLLASAAARHATLTAGRPVLYAASGLSAADVTARIGAAHAGVNYQHLRAGSLDAPADVQSALDAVLAAPLYIDDGEDITVDALTETVPDVEDLALVVLDRLQAVPDEAVPLSGPALPDATRALARLARTAHVPVLAAVDSDDEALLATLRADVLVRLRRNGDSAQVTVTDADFDTPGAGVRLWPDFPRARFLDTAPATPVQPAEPTRAPAPPAPAAEARTGPTTPQQAAPAARQPSASRRRLPSQNKTPEAVEFLTGRVHAALAEHGGDTEAATAALVHKAIPDVMELLEICRQGGRYDFSCHPALPDLLHKQPGRDSDEIWEARPKWSVDAGVLAPGEHQVTALDMNGAYLSALKTHLPIGALEHHLGPDEGGPAWDKRRSGIHRVTPPVWDHSGMPNPLGNREEPGPLWVGEPTLRLLLRAADKGWCDGPLIHESFTSGASEGLLEKMREGMTAARRTALEAGDEVTVEYIKAMYSKFVSTMGESNFNREIYRPDWVHLIRSQAFANLWHKAEKAHRAGLQAVRMMGTDELHVIGDWQPVFDEGRDVTQVKIKDTYGIEIEEEG